MRFGINRKAFDLDRSIHSELDKTFAVHFKKIVMYTTFRRFS
jgi:hypothetical protein